MKGGKIILLNNPTNYSYPANLFIDIFGDVYVYKEQLGLLLLNILNEKYNYTDREVKLIKLRYKYYHTYNEISEMLKISPERVRQILINIICKTRYFTTREKIFTSSIDNYIINKNIKDEYDEWYYENLQK